MCRYVYKKRIVFPGNAFIIIDIRNNKPLKLRRMVKMRTYSSMYDFDSTINDFLAKSAKGTEQFDSSRRAVENVREVMRHMPGGAFSEDSAEV